MIRQNFREPQEVHFACHGHIRLKYMQGKSVSEVCVLFIACIDAFFRGYVTSKSLNNIHDFMFQLYCYVYLNFNMQNDIFLLSGKSQQIVVV